MIPLSLAPYNTDLEIVKISGTTESKHHLEKMGFYKGQTLKVLSNQNGNMIILLLDGKLAIGNQLSKKIFVR